MTKKISKLSWFLDFMWTDVKEGKAEELAKLAVELGLMITGRPIAGPDPRRSGEIFSEASAEADLYDYSKEGAGRLRLIRLQDSLKDYFLEIIGQMKAMSDEGIPVPDVPFSGYFSRPTICEYPVITIEQEIELRVNIKSRAIRTKDTPSIMQICSRDEFENATMQVWEVGKGEEETMRYHFVRSLDGANLSQIKHCPECERYFLHTTKRERVFCSNRCAARKNSRERRARMKAEEPEKYQAILKRNAKRAKDSYERKIRKDHPKAKIGRSA